MAKIPNDELERLKNTISLTRLVEGAGIELKKSGKDLIGLCPFHEEATASLVISETKNVFHCFGCNASGTVIDWIMKTQGISFRHAVELLQNDVALNTAPNPVKRSSRKALDTLKVNEDDQALLNHVIDFYHQTLLQNQEALAYVEKRGLGNRELIERFKLGYANRTLAYRLPEKQLKAGRELRTQLQTIGILRDSGHEHLNGSIVIPIFDERNSVVQAYGRKIRDDLRSGTPRHLYLPGPHRGVFNRDGIANQKEVILCEALIDALTFYHAGYRNVTSSYGVNGFTDELLNTFIENNIQRVLIAYDRDAAGDKAAIELADKLSKHNIACYRLHFPKGSDTNAFALQTQPANKSLGLVIRSAEWIAGGKKPTVNNAKQRFEQQLKEAAEQVEVINNIKPILPEPEIKNTPAEITPIEKAPIEVAQAEPDQAESIEADIADHEITLNFSDRRYRIRGFSKNHNYETLRINLLASCGEMLHVDTLDIYSARHRQTFIKQAASELSLDENILKKDIGKVLLKLELLQEQHIQKSLEPKEQAIVLSDEESQSALALLKSPDLLNQIIHDVERCGLVGENNNALASYLACVSRKLNGPLAIIVQSTSAAGKSSLMDAVLAMMPEEDRIQYSAMTGQSLFYMGETNLKHKILAIAEEEGAAQASYALKLLQSEGELTIASTAKDPQSGRLETQEYRVEGPVMLFLTTTAIEIDDELLNRCLVLTINEDRSQTQAIHQLQRKKRTLDGLLQKEHKKTILDLHRNAQRLLKPRHVVNPYAEQLTFLDDKTRTRRDHEKYLTLIDAITLLHQYQRKTHVVNHNKERIEYIEVTLDDIAIANQLAHDILGRTLDELPPQTRRLLKLIYAMVQTHCKEKNIDQCDYRFSRREIRDATDWGNTQLKIHLARLVDMEYLLIHSGGHQQRYVYELRYQGQGESNQQFMLGLIDANILNYDANRSGQNDNRSGSGRAAVGGQSATGRGEKNTKNKTASITYSESNKIIANGTDTVQENALS